MSRALPPPLHLVTDDGVLAGAGFEALARVLLEDLRGVVALHLRGHGTGGARLYALATALSAVARRTGSTLLVNDRVDVALAAAAHGVQLGRRSLPLEAARRLLGPERLLGYSAHAGEEARAAAAAGADFALLGPVHATPSHPGRGGAGAALLRSAADGPPIIAIGGITPARVANALRAGACGIAVLSGVWGASDPARAARGYAAALAAAELATRREG